MPTVPPTRLYSADDRQWEESPDGVRYLRVATTPGDPNRPLIILSQLPPDYVEPAHTHDASYVEVVLDGTIRVGKHDMAKGDMRAMQGGAGYGPLVAGPEGCLRLTIFESAIGSVMHVLGRDAPAPH